MPQPAKTPTAPGNLLGVCPASSSASQQELEKMAVLRIENCCLARGEAEEASVEPVHIRQHHGCLDVVWVRKSCGAFPQSEELFVAQPPGCLAPSTDELPELPRVA